MNSYTEWKEEATGKNILYLRCNGFHIFLTCVRRFSYHDNVISDEPMNKLNILFENT